MLTFHRCTWLGVQLPSTLLCWKAQWAEDRKISYLRNQDWTGLCLFFCCSRLFWGTTLHLLWRGTTLHLLWRALANCCSVWFPKSSPCICSQLSPSTPGDPADPKRERSQPWWRNQFSLGCLLLHWNYQLCSSLWIMNQDKENVCVCVFTILVKLRNLVFKVTAFEYNSIWKWVVILKKPLKSRHFTVLFILEKSKGVLPPGLTTQC